MSYEDLCFDQVLAGSTHSLINFRTKDSNIVVNNHTYIRLLSSYCIATYR